MNEMTKEYIDSHLANLGEVGYTIFEISVIGSKFYVTDEERNTDYDILVIGEGFSKGLLQNQVYINDRKYDIIVFTLDYLKHIATFPSENILQEVWTVNRIHAKKPFYGKVHVDWDMGSYIEEMKIATRVLLRNYFNLYANARTELQPKAFVPPYVFFAMIRDNTPIITDKIISEVRDMYLGDGIDQVRFVERQVGAPINPEFFKEPFQRPTLEVTKEGIETFLKHLGHANANVIAIEETGSKLFFPDNTRTSDTDLVIICDELNIANVKYRTRSMSGEKHDLFVYRYDRLMEITEFPDKMYLDYMNIWNLINRKIYGDVDSTWDFLAHEEDYKETLRFVLDMYIDKPGNPSKTLIHFKTFAQPYMILKMYEAGNTELTPDLLDDIRSIYLRNDYPKVKWVMDQLGVSLQSSLIQRYEER